MIYIPVYLSNKYLAGLPYFHTFSYGDAKNAECACHHTHFFDFREFVKHET
jgi:hypothetical protein